MRIDPRRCAPLVLLAAIGSSACVSLWPTLHVAVAAAPPDVLACAIAQAKQMGYRVGPDTAGGSLTAQKTLPFKDLGPDVTEYSREDVLAVSVRPARAAGGTAVTIEAETIHQQGRREMGDVPVSASAEVRANADTLLARCRDAAPNTSLP